MITVVSQKAINQQLSALWDKEKLKADRLSKMIEQRKAKGEKPPFTDIKWPGLVRWESRTTASLPPAEKKGGTTTTAAPISDEPQEYNPDEDEPALLDDYTRIEADMGPPEVQLRLADYKHFVTYRIHLMTGKFFFYSAGQKKFVPIDNWKLAFSVNMDLKELSDNSTAPQHVKETIEKVLKENLNDYSIQQLTVDFSSADLARLDTKEMDAMESSSWKKLSATPKNLFKNYLEKYVTMLQDTKGSHELGYAAVKKPRPETASNPTITPSAVTFSNLAFIGPDGKEFISASDAEGGGDNMLVYLQTTKKGLPKDAMPPSANWLIPSPKTEIKRDGTMCISAENFLDGWLMDKLKLINVRAAFAVEVAEPTWGVASKMGIAGGYSGMPLVFSVGTDALGGHVDVEGHDAKWLRKFDAGQSPDKPDPNTIARFYEWKFETSAGDPKRFQVKAKSSTWLRIPIGAPGEKCAITFGGRLEATTLDNGTLINTHASAWTEWKCSIIFDGVSEGELIIKAGDFSRTTPESWNDEGFFDKGDTQWVNEFAKKMFDQMDIEDVINDLKEYLNGSWGFVFGGAETFYIDNLMFNKNGDLLASLVYKT